MDKRTESALLGKARHNLKNPVNAILGYSEMLIEDCEDEGLDHLIPDIQKLNTAGEEILDSIENIFNDSALVENEKSISSMAEDGAKGVDMSKSESPDLILMDLSLPVMDDWEATSTIKADDSTKSIPIIVLTAHAMAGDREKALEAGADEYDTKPIDFKRLLGKIKDFI